MHRPTALRTSAFYSVLSAVLGMLAATDCSGGAADSGEPLGRAVQAAGAAPLRVDGGAHHTLVLRANGAVWTFGANASGQLGDGTTTDRSTPSRSRG